MNTETIADCMKLSFADTPFPVVVQKLAGAGVRAYRADLMTLRKTYYGHDAASFDKDLPLDRAPDIAPAFDAARVEATVRGIQKGEFGYAEFLRRIMAAGCASYDIFIDGRKAVYLGRDGETFTELFPPKSN